MKAYIGYQLYCYDYQTGKTEKVSDKNISDYYVDINNGILYYFVISLISATLSVVTFT